MLTERKRAWLSAGILVTALTVLVVAVMLSPLRELFTSPERLRETVQSYGALGPIIVVGIHILQVVIAPIPGQGIDLANGYLFGWWGGALVSLIGISLGTMIAISLAKKFGRPLVEILVGPKGLASVRAYTHSRSQWLFFILFLLPGTPDDLLCFAIGLTSISLWRAVAIAVLGRLPGVLAAVGIGATGRGLNVLEFTIVAAVVSLLAGWILWKTPLGKAMKVPKLPDNQTS